MAEQIVADNDSVDQGAVDEHNQEMLNLVESQQVPTETPGIVNEEDKFGGDYNKLKQSYDELEKKFHSPTTPVETQEELGIAQEPVVANEGAIDMSSLTEEYKANGGLSDKSYGDLEKAGFSREHADSYIAGQKALGAQMGAQVKGVVGGDEVYGTMVEWAKANYTEDQIAAYDSAVNSGNMDTATLAAKGLMSDYQNSTGSAGKTYGGSEAPQEGVGDVFRSNAEVVDAMKDPRYEYDSAYRQDVLKKLDGSDIFSQGRL